MKVSLFFVFFFVLFCFLGFFFFIEITVELQWLEHLWDYENFFETGVVRAIEGL